MAPETARPGDESISSHGLTFAGRASRAGLLALAVLACAVAPSHAFKVTTWNLWNYPGSVFAERQPAFRTVMGHLDTDVIFVQELSSQAGADSFLINVLRVARPSRVWKSTGFLSGTQSALFYDSLTVMPVPPPNSIATGGPRSVFQAVVTPRGYAANAARIRILSVHFKAGNGSTDSTDRRLECTSLRNTLNAASSAAPPNILLGGDTNFYGSWEGGYIRLLENQLDNDGRLRDHVTLPGTWNTSLYKEHHSQSTCFDGCWPGQSGSGLDDRFDFFLYSYQMWDGEGVDYHSTTVFGNDGAHYNNSVDGDNFNLQVPIAVARALENASDHLPVISTLQLPAKISTLSALDLGSAIVGAGTVSQNLSVMNGGVLLPVDELDYTMVAPVGFTLTSGGPFIHVAGDPPNVHSIGMLANSVGNKAGTLVFSTDDVDSLTKNVLLSGKVLAHAVASLDSTAPVASDTVDFGLRVQGDFNDQPVRVHNLDFDPLQARLSVTGASITGGGGRFSIVGGFTPGLVSDVARTYSIHFDDDGATLDQVYEATLTIQSSDEPLPGATAQPALTVLLRAQPKSVTGVEGDALPQVVSFLPARPNPMSRETMLAFELPRAADARLEVFDLSGRQVATIAEGSFAPGRHALRWNATGAGGARVEAGLYFARFTTAGYRLVQRLVVLP